MNCPFFELKDYQSKCVRDKLRRSESEDAILRRAYTDLDCVDELVKRHLREWHTIVNKIIGLDLESEESVPGDLDMWSSSYEEITKAQYAKSELTYEKWREQQVPVTNRDETNKFPLKFGTNPPMTSNHQSGMVVRRLILSSYKSSLTNVPCRHFAAGTAGISLVPRHASAAS